MGQIGSRHLFLLLARLRAPEDAGRIACDFLAGWHDCFLVVLEPKTYSVAGWIDTLDTSCTFCSNFRHCGVGVTTIDIDEAALRKVQRLFYCPEDDMTSPAKPVRMLHQDHDPRITRVGERIRDALDEAYEQRISVAAIVGLLEMIQQDILAQQRDH